MRLNEDTGTGLPIDPIDSGGDDPAGHPDTPHEPPPDISFT
jgi:hypothetical protein